VAATPGRLPFPRIGAQPARRRGQELNELQEIVDIPDETDDLLRLALHRLPIREFPLLRCLAAVLANYDGAAELERGLTSCSPGLPQPLALRPILQAT
jgi:hypothetical protein